MLNIKISNIIHDFVLNNEELINEKSEVALLIDHIIEANK